MLFFRCASKLQNRGFNHLRLSKFVQISKFFSVSDNRLLSDIRVICQKFQFEVRMGCQGLYLQ